LSVNLATTGCSHQPGGGIFGDAFERPLLQSGEEGIPDGILGRREVTSSRSQVCNELSVCVAGDLINGGFG
jgi:hypothetical protein